MSREKQIEEMFTDIIAAHKSAVDYCADQHGCERCDHRIHGKWCDYFAMAESLYEQGYRKQSEGEWSHGVNDTVKCSICRRRMPKIYCMNFCPHCGAKMKGV